MDYKTFYFLPQKTIWKYFRFCKWYLSGRKDKNFYIILLGYLLSKNINPWTILTPVNKNVFQSHSNLHIFKGILRKSVSLKCLVLNPCGFKVKRLVLTNSLMVRRTGWLLEWHINNPFVVPSVMTFGPTKGGRVHYFIWTNQKTKSSVFLWLCPHAMFDITCFPAFVGALDLFEAFCRYINCDAIDNKKWLKMLYLLIILS